MRVKSLSRVRLPATPWTAAHQAPLSMGFSRQEYWSGVPLPSPYPSLAKGLMQSEGFFTVKREVGSLAWHLLLSQGLHTVF